MRMCQSRGVIIVDHNDGLKYVEIPVTLRTERTGDFCTLSLSDDKGIMIEAVVTPAVRKLLKGII